MPAIGCPRRVVDVRSPPSRPVAVRYIVNIGNVADCNTSQSGVPDTCAGCQAHCDARDPMQTLPRPVADVVVAKSGRSTAESTQYWQSVAA